MSNKKEELINKDLDGDMRGKDDEQAPKETRPKAGDENAD